MANAINERYRLKCDDCIWCDETKQIKNDENTEKHTYANTQSRTFFLVNYDFLGVHTESMHARTHAHAPTSMLQMSEYVRVHMESALFYSHNFLCRFIILTCFFAPIDIKRHRADNIIKEYQKWQTRPSTHTHLCIHLANHLVRKESYEAEGITKILGAVRNSSSICIWHIWCNNFLG